MKRLWELWSATWNVKLTLKLANKSKLTPTAKSTSMISNWADMQPSMNDWAIVKTPRIIKFTGDFRRTLSQHTKVSIVTITTTSDTIQSHGLARTNLWVGSCKTNKQITPDVTRSCTWKKTVVKNELSNKVISWLIKTLCYQFMHYSRLKSQRLSEWTLCVLIDRWIRSLWLQGLLDPCRRLAGWFVVEGCTPAAVEVEDSKPADAVL